jgi:hypothetical protein
VKAFIVLVCDGDDPYSESDTNGVFATVGEAQAHIDNDLLHRSWYSIEEWDGAKLERVLNHEGKPLFI